MRTRYGIFFALLVLACARPLLADDGAVVVALTAQKVVRAADGKETFTSADKLGPGDVVEYRAVYRNRSAGPVRNVLANLPVPAAGFEYIAETAAPALQSASLDGKTFSPVPLKRTVVLTNGQREELPVPLREYRALRWQIGDLAAGASVTVKARMQVVTGPAGSR